MILAIPEEEPNANGIRPIITRPPNSLDPDEVMAVTTIPVKTRKRTNEDQ
nr:hypothetical protein [Methanococcoides methylutens]